jgi:hypothetical protein
LSWLGAYERNFFLKYREEDIACVGECTFMWEDLVSSHDPLLEVSLLEVVWLDAL